MEKTPIYTIRNISAKSTYLVRQLVLRPGRPAAECKLVGDDEENTFHLGVFLDEKLVGVASFMESLHPVFPEPEQYQLRGMAILPEVRHQKLGAQLLLEGENILKGKGNGILLWFNARLTAVGFYEKSGYKTTGEPFYVPNICMHILMRKIL